MKHLFALVCTVLLVAGCGKDDDGGGTPTFLCPERTEIVGTWDVLSVTEFEYNDNRTPPEAPVAEFVVEFYADDTGLQRFADSRPSRDLEYFFPRDSCTTRLTTVSLGTRIVNSYEQLEATTNSRVWRTAIDLFIGGSGEPEDLIGRQTITWNMERQ